MSIGGAKNMSALVAAALTAGVDVGPRDKAVLNTMLAPKSTRPRRKSRYRTPANRSQEQERRRRQIERGQLRVENGLVRRIGD